jgi:predicted nucleic acid-binding protein
MRFTIDTSIIIAVIANEPQKQAIIHATRGAELLAPKSLHWEIGNAFSAMLRRGRVEVDAVRAALELYRSIPIRRIEVDLAEAMDLCATTGLYAYDAYILLCARLHRAPLLTLDRALERAAYSLSIPILELPS